MTSYLYYLQTKTIQAHMHFFVPLAFGQTGLNSVYPDQTPQNAASD